MEQLCTEERLAKRRLGGAGAKKLRARLADLTAASRVVDLIAGHPHPLQRGRQGQFSVSLDGGCRLVFAPANHPMPLTPAGAIDWQRVTEIRIVFIGDYHD